MDWFARAVAMLAEGAFYLTLALCALTIASELVEIRKFAGLALAEFKSTSDDTRQRLRRQDEEALDFMKLQREVREASLATAALMNARLLQERDHIAKCEERYLARVAESTTAKGKAPKPTTH